MSPTFTTVDLAGPMMSKTAVARRKEKRNAGRNSDPSANAEPSDSESSAESESGPEPISDPGCMMGDDFENPNQPGPGNAPAGPDPTEEIGPANDPEQVVEENPSPREETPTGNEVRK